MSEKRFEFYSDDYLIGVLDTVTGKTLNHFATIDLLNEQSDTIEGLILDRNRQEEKLDIARRNLSKQLEKIEELEEENEQLRQENNFLKQIREAFQIDVKNSR